MDNDLFPDDKPSETPAQPAVPMRECSQCGTSFVVKKSTQRFCCNKCKDTFNNARRPSKAAAMNGTDTPAAPPAAPVPTTGKAAEWQKDLPIHYKIAMDLIERDRDAWQERCKKLEKEKEELEDELITIEEQSALKDHQLNGLMDQQPSGFQKFISSIPAEVMTELAPRIGSVVDWMLNGAQKGLSGSQIDPGLAKQLEGFLTWFGALSPELQGKVQMFITMLSHKDARELDTLITKLNSILNYDNPIKQQQQFYGAFNAGAFASPIVS